MYRLAVLATSIFLAVPFAAGAAQPQPKRLAGPWYTPQELRALIAYSDATFAEKQRILAGEPGR